MSNPNEKHYEKIADLGCILCLRLGHGATPCEIHHIRHFGMPRDQSPVIGLCPEHHRGNTGVHGLGKKSFARHYKIDEDGLLTLTEKRLGIKQIVGHPFDQ